MAPISPRPDKDYVEPVQLNELQMKIWRDRYALRDTTGKPIEQTVEQMWRRVAKAIAAVERSQEDRARWEDNFYDILENFRFVPGGRILSGAGTGTDVTYFNCYVLPSPEDSREGIMQNITAMIDMMARGGGVGVNLSSLRPRGTHVKTVNGTSSGPVPWAELYSVATGRVIQQGGSRRGALMLMLDDNHPDIMEFITAKAIDPRTSKPSNLEYANISVSISDTFMDAVKADGEWQLVWGGQLYKTIRARELWDLICTYAWKSADPGLVFMERYNKMLPTYYCEEVRCVNPCGEQGLSPWSVCNLGAINLAAFVGKDGKFDFAALGHTAAIATRFLDNVIDAAFYFREENEKAQRFGIRRTGLGIMGLADAFILMGVKYGNIESLKIIDRIMECIRNTAYTTSIGLGISRGSFALFDPVKHADGAFVKTLPRDIQHGIKTMGLRNGVLLTVAPTGTTSLLAGVSSGLEPIYDFVMKRVDRTGESIITHPLLAEWKATHPTADVPSYFVGAKNLTPEEHIAVQARVQRYIDSSISKTINGPFEDTIDDVKRLYMLAYDSGCKGVTYYRDNSRDAVLTSVTAAPQVAPPVPQPKAPDTIKPRPTVLNGYTRNIKAPEGTVNVTINSDAEGPIEVFVTVGRAGSDISGLAEAIGRLASLTLRVPSSMTPRDRLSELASQLKGIGGSRSIGFGKSRVTSLPDALAQVFMKHLEVEPEPDALPQPLDTGPQLPPHQQMETLGLFCPGCGSVSSYVMEEGCKKCYACGYSEC